MNEDIFAKIIAREIPADIVYEDEHTLAFLDLHPVNPGHTLVVPKEFSRNILDISPDAFAKVAETVRTLSRVIKEAMGADGINIHMNNEPAAGQEVFRTHLHIIPRHHGDGLEHWHGAESEAELRAATAEKIRTALARAS